mmetsp:Transcript_995/g.1534  ORF Transcript_995/g.1534 Transcript_995/m.1534 type:complete len:213 (-) Transcript_995:467-1105(-)
MREKIMSGDEIASAHAVRSDRKPKSTQAKRNARANAAQLQNNGERDLSKLKCYNCQAMGHYARDCPKPQRSRNNETSNPSGSSLRRGKSARSQAATAPSSARLIIVNGILPAFYMIFGMDPKRFPTVFKVWLAYVNLALERRFTRDNDPNRVVVITCDEYCINITFCADSSAMHRAFLSSKIIADDGSTDTESDYNSRQSASDDDSCPTFKL